MFNIEKYIILTFVFGVLFILPGCFFGDENTQCVRCVEPLCEGTAHDSCSCGCPTNMRREIDGIERVCTAGCWQKLDEKAECTGVDAAETPVCGDDANNACNVECGCMSCDPNVDVTRGGNTFTCSFLGCLDPA